MVGAAKASSSHPVTCEASTLLRNAQLTDPNGRKKTIAHLDCATRVIFTGALRLFLAVMPGAKKGARWLGRDDYQTSSRGRQRGRKTKKNVFIHLLVLLFYCLSLLKGFCERRGVMRCFWAMWQGENEPQQRMGRRVGVKPTE
ncbi:hypothetical protein TraAM80_10292 [Trypanosoma rangeli]|uniref:Uncharacterized protein n=1 Tax=Trypanosoma rangeli TaxID=5698 RepID=A0A422MPZ7_TRYRA|nr:uncharacterized protein TraAM80_10292 [Trypanosoma rangeli]RNE95282.1 hypothetical protein TraAM80_10292 [Trypanosoma rangeli]|eukprot:RNE95282.1 hypothetical protein TraAM80_10292 [Trypanosoma rangeli]